MPANDNSRGLFASGLRQQPAQARRSRARRADSTAARLRAGIVLMLVVLLPLQIASAAMVRLWRPAHYHPSLLKAVVEKRSSGIVVATLLAGPALADASPKPSAATPQSATEPESDASHPHPHDDHGHLQQQHPHPHAHVRPHPHEHADPADHPSGPIPPLPRTLVRTPEPPAHTHEDRHTARAAHAHAHDTAGIGHHRHTHDDPDVVYIDSDASAQTPATLPTRSLDGTVMLLPAALPLPGATAVGSRSPRSAAGPLIAHYATPGERPPR